MLKIEEAKKELASKTMDVIQTETAIKWASRAAAAYENSLQAEGPEKIADFIDAEEFLHEALEHASLTADTELVDTIKLDVLSYRTRAADSIEALFSKEKSE